MNQHPNEIMSDQTPPSTSRRQFLKASTTAALGSVFAANLSFPEKTFAANSDTLKVGLIGCGGRGTGAANQALNADKNVVLTAMADVFENQLQGSLRTLKGEVGESGRDASRVPRAPLPVEQRDGLLVVVRRGGDVQSTPRSQAGLLVQLGPPARVVRQLDGLLEVPLGEVGSRQGQ